MNIGFIGLGNMGAGMAHNLLMHCKDSDNTLIVLDINESALTDFIAKGAINGESTSKMCPQCDVLFTSLPSSKEVNLLAFGNEGILHNLKEGAAWFETTTNELAEWEKVKEHAPNHLTLIDAPVSGGAERAAAGTLTTFLGIEKEVLKKFESLLKVFASKVIRMGPSGSGYVTKLVQLHLNYLAAQGIGETLMMGAKANLDLNTLHSVLMNSCSQSYVVENYIPKVHEEGMKLIKPGVACKDIALELNKIFEEYGLLESRTFGYGHSFGVLSHYYGREAGVELREDIDTVLQKNMVVSMEPMIMIPEGQPGAGGYREHDIMVITEDSAYDITKFPYGPKHNIITN